MSKSGSLAFLLPAALALASCSRPAGEATRSSAARMASEATRASSQGGGVVAEVDGSPVLASDLEPRVSSRLVRLRQEEYEIRRQALDELIAERLVAAEAVRRGISPEELLRQEVDAKVVAVPASQVEALYQQNRARLGGMSREEALARIREVLDERSTAERRASFEKGLREASRVTVHLEVPRVAVDIPSGAPSLGAPDAPVTIVEFTDYQCPYCHRAQSVVDQLLSRYEGKIRLVHLDFPLDGHPEAVPAARAARCAGEQGRFWEYHRSLMTSPGELDEADLKSRASTLGLRPGDFDRCLSSDRHDAAIHAALQQGAELGVTGTPAYFINGRMLSGARPIESFTEIIDAELAGS